MDRFFFSIPGLKQLASYLSQSDRPMNFQEIVEHFGNLEDVDLVVFPEGSNCFFGHPDKIQEFRSARFVELSIKTGAPVLICVHRGSEAWGMTVNFDESTLHLLKALPDPIYQFVESYLKIEERGLKSRLITLPLWPKPMQRFDMLCELYQPKVQAENAEEFKVQAEFIRGRMQAMLQELDQLRRADGIIDIYASSEVKSDLEAIGTTRGELSSN